METAPRRRFVYLNESFARSLAKRRLQASGATAATFAITVAQGDQHWELAESIMHNGELIPIGTAVALVDKHPDATSGDIAFFPQSALLDFVCIFQVPGFIVTEEGARVEPPLGAAGEFVPIGGVSLIGGVVATVSTSPIEFIVVPVPIAIDIKPDSDTNPINPFSRGVIPVAILGSPTFDVADVDVTTLAFGPRCAPPAHRKGGHPEGVNDDGLTEGSTLKRVDFSGTSSSGGTVTGTFGVYEVPPGTSLVPVVASNIEFTATGMSDSNGSFTGWRNVFGDPRFGGGSPLGSVFLDFTNEPPELSVPDEIGVSPEGFFIEDNQLLWHLHPSMIVPGPRGTPFFRESFFHRRILPLGFFSRLFTEPAPLTLTTTTVPEPGGRLLSHYRTEETGIATGDVRACVTGETLDGNPLRGLRYHPDRADLRHRLRAGLPAAAADVAPEPSSTLGRSLGGSLDGLDAQDGGLGKSLCIVLWRDFPELVSCRPLLSSTRVKPARPAGRATPIPGRGDARTRPRVAGIRGMLEVDRPRSTVGGWRGLTEDKPMGARRRRVSVRILLVLMIGHWLGAGCASGVYRHPLLVSGDESSAELVILRKSELAAGASALLVRLDGEKLVKLRTGATRSFGSGRASTG